LAWSQTGERRAIGARLGSNGSAASDIGLWAIRSASLLRKSIVDLGQRTSLPLASKSPIQNMCQREMDKKVYFFSILSVLHRINWIFIHAF
jgi:hypothetical protein